MARIDTAGFAEWVYRGLDRVVFGSAPMVERCESEELRVTFNGRPADQLEQAVRERLGQAGGTVEVSVWSGTSSESILLYRGQCALDHRSLHRSIAWVHAKVPALLAAAKARRIHGVGRNAIGVASCPRGAPIAVYNLMARLVAEVFGRVLYQDQWFIQLHAPPEQGIGVGRRLAKITPPRDRFWADPFLHRRDGRLWLFFEELLFGATNAHLCAVEIDESGRLLDKPQRVLVEPWHLSYPFLWEEEGQLFMIPESSAHASVDLYECTSFPSKWRKRCTLIDGAMHADATVVRYGERLWMFSTSTSAGGSLYDELHLHSSDRIEGPWQAHPLNPVKVDARSARPAGCMWIDLDGYVVRPVQDCSTIYGGAVRLQRVTTLARERFEEVDLGQVQAPPALLGERFHTFNSQGSMFAIDSLHRQLRGRSRVATRA